MAANLSIIDLFVEASTAVQLVLLILIALSILSWAIIVQKLRLLKKAEQQLQTFEALFWQPSTDYAALFEEKSAALEQHPEYGISEVFVDGYAVFQQLRGNVACATQVKRIMHVTINRIHSIWQENLTVLATIGSTSPYIGLFGTVWGIMHALHMLGNVKQATIAMVAPGISEALVATAIGLFAAIPAVIAYNIINRRIEKLYEQFDNFVEEFYVVLKKNEKTT